MSSQTIAFFGATGGCAGYALSNTLKAGYTCTALARTPAKLTQSMKEKGVPTDVLDRQLTIIQGNIKDIEAVKQTLRLEGRVVDTIVSGIGGTPVLQWSLWYPVTLTDPTICQDAGRTILQALMELKPAKKPTLINVSTTGISPQGYPRDVPLAFVPLYHWLLHVPHEDKRVLEQMLTEHIRIPENERFLSAYVNIKPSLLLDGEGKGLETVRQGVDEAPAVGYTIQRGDVGTFIFERLIRNGVKAEQMNKSLSITY